jgi:glucarate dehydratase
MEIRDFEVIPVAHREPPLRNSWGIHSELEARTIVRVVTADGEAGIGETYGNNSVISHLNSATTLVEGMNPLDQKALDFRLNRGGGRGGGSPHAYGAIETALLDLVGKTIGEPVYNLLGGKVRDAVPFSAYLFYKDRDSDPDSAAIAPQEVMSPEAMVEEAREFVDQHGFEVLKLKAGVLEPSEEVRTLELLAEEFGAETPLRIDPNGVWSVETATEVARELRGIDGTIQFLEDPVPTMNAHARLKQRTDYPMATNMFVTDFSHIPQAIQSNAVDIVLSDHHMWGGLRSSMELDRILRTFDRGVGMHSNSHLGVSMAAMAHLGAALPTLRYACDTHYPWENDDVIQDAPIEFENGDIQPPGEPGLGVELDENELQRLNQRYNDHNIERDDTAKLLERDPDWMPNSPRW